MAATGFIGRDLVLSNNSPNSSANMLYNIPNVEFEYGEEEANTARKLYTSDVEELIRHLKLARSRYEIRRDEMGDLFDDLYGKVKSLLEGRENFENTEENNSGADINYDRIRAGELAAYKERIGDNGLAGEAAKRNAVWTGDEKREAEALENDFGAGDMEDPSNPFSGLQIGDGNDPKQQRVSTTNTRRMRKFSEDYHHSDGSNIQFPPPGTGPTVTAFPTRELSKAQLKDQGLSDFTGKTNSVGQWMMEEEEIHDDVEKVAQFFEERLKEIREVKHKATEIGGMEGRVISDLEELRDHILDWRAFM